MDHANEHKTAIIPGMFFLRMSVAATSGIVQNTELWYESFSIPPLPLKTLRYFCCSKADDVSANLLTHAAVYRFIPLTFFDLLNLEPDKMFVYTSWHFYGYWL